MTGETLTAFLAARLDEDAAEARFVHVIDCSLAFVSPEHCQCDCGTPARVLREVAAKRAIIRAVFGYEAMIDGEWGCCHEADEIAAGGYPEHKPDEIMVLCHLASVYSDHPGWRAEWTV